MSAEAAQEAIQAALAMLARASADWRNGDVADPGMVHWPVVVCHARKLLKEAISALSEAEDGERELLREAATRLQGWSAGAGPDGRLIERSRPRSPGR